MTNGSLQGTEEASEASAVDMFLKPMTMTFWLQLIRSKAFKSGGHSHTPSGLQAASPAVEESPRLEDWFITSGRLSYSPYGELVIILYIYIYIVCLYIFFKISIHNMYMTLENPHVQ